MSCWPSFWLGIGIGIGAVLAPSLLVLAWACATAEDEPNFDFLPPLAPEREGRVIDLDGRRRRR